MYFLPLIFLKMFITGFIAQEISRALFASKLRYFHFIYIIMDISRDRSAFFMRKDARDVTRKKICMRPTARCQHLATRRKLSKSHRIDIRRVFASANCAALVELCMIDGDQIVSLRECN